MKLLRKWDDALPLERTLSIFTFTISTIIMITIFLRAYGLIKFPTKYFVPLFIILMTTDGINAWRRSKAIAIFYFILALLFVYLFYLNWN